MRHTWLSVLVYLSALSPSLAQSPPHGLQVPAGFEVTEFADSTLSNDIFCMTLDPHGRVVVSGRGFIRLLLDENGDGRADRVVDFAGAPKDGAMGLFWEGDTLFCMGDGGLRCYRDANGAGRERPPELLYKFKTGGEHDAHAICRGPDGWLYVLCGNGTGIGRQHASLPTSPIKEPTAGAVLRFPPDFKGCEIVADGFRNAYGFTFNCDGDLFTYDSDNERCVSLPWYEPTRCYHVVSGGHYGWQSPQHAQTWRKPPYFLDVTAPIATLGRGSPTGIVCYRHVQFPAEYRGGLFLCDWTFGRVYFLKLETRGSSYVSHPEVFLQAVGENGFAPTAAAVHPVTGDLYVSIGGRGTRGAVYRIRYPSGMANSKPSEVAQLQPPASSLDWQPGTQQQWLDGAADADLRRRRHALDMIRRHRGQFTSEQLTKVIQVNAGQKDRGLRQATAALLDDSEQREGDKATGDPRAEITWDLSRPGFEVIHRVGDKAIPPETRLEAVRIVQLALGDLMAASAKGTVWEGYSRQRSDVAPPGGVRAVLRAAFPSGHADLDRELTRTLAMIEDDDAATLERVAAQLTEMSDPIEDIHFLIVLARLKGPRPVSVTQRVATALLALDYKINQRHLNRDLNWPLRIAELHAELAHKDPALNAALVGSPEFGRPGHVLFARCPGFDRQKAAEILLARSPRDADHIWDDEQIRLLGALPPEHIYPLLRRLWGEQGVDDAILSLLARVPHEVDRDRFLSGLASSRLEVVLLALDALEKLSPQKAPRDRDRDELLAVILALRRVPEEKETARVRERLLSYLTQRTGQKLTTTAAWVEWYGRTYPERAARLGDADGVDVATWSKRLAAVEWLAGNVERGRLLFTKVNCASCHSGAQALGPDLRGVAGRFSRADLFTAILQPSKDVSPRYRTTQIVTASGKVYQGLIIYEAVDSVLLQTGPAETVRLANPQVRERRLTSTSLMPAGLLDKLSDRDLADLYAYLQALGKPQ
jgi:putative heme-binding domain-containing protein